MGLYRPALGLSSPGMDAEPSLRPSPHAHPCTLPDPLILQASLFPTVSLSILPLSPSSFPCSPPPSRISPRATRTLSHAPLSSAGELTTTSLLDRETKAEYILIVRAVDGGVGHNQKTGIATVSACPSHAPRPCLPCPPGSCSPAHL